MKPPILSVITIVYNNEKHIERTLLSVIKQTYQPIEYIIIDGKSTDKTLEIIDKYADDISILISEKDKGIYDAMNKGLQLATGDYILFMNSGDEIYDNETVEKIFKHPAADIYYGETLMIDEQLNELGIRRHRVPEKLTVDSFKYGMCVSHQAIYIKKELCSSFNLDYELSSDIDWILEAIKRAKIICNTQIIVAKYLVGGMSKTKHWQSLKERFVIMKKQYGLLPTLFFHTIIAINLSFYWLINKRTND